MNRKYFLKKKIFAAFPAISTVLLQIIIRTYKIIFTKRTLLFVTDHKIRSINFGPFSQLCIILSFAWIVNLFNQSLRYNEIINSKSEEINKLQSVNSYFREEFSDVNEKLRKINDYLISVTGNNHHKVSGEEKPKFKTPEKIKENDLSSDDQQTLNELKASNEMLSDLHSFTRHRIKTIEDAITITGLNIKPSNKAFKKPSPTQEKEISLNNKKDLSLRQGGPLEEVGAIDANIPYSQEDLIEKHLEKAEFSGDLDRLTMLENLLKVMPLAKPMKHYYISSGFGSRTDPILGSYAIHKGLDFAGPEHEKVLSPSNGRVVLAGPFNGYGKAIVIDHGFGITTRYGHLATVKVSEGQIVKKGDIIAIQGNTGRSTGSHLHYEVRYRNTPLNPKKFIEAGDSLFNDTKNVRYVNS